MLGVPDIRFINQELPPILTRLGLAPEAFIKHQRGRKGKPHTVALGCIEKMREAAREMGNSFFKGLGEVKALYLNSTG